jgi:hypothetical protein
VAVKPIGSADVAPGFSAAHCKIADSAGRFHLLMADEFGCPPFMLPCV